jgi:NitT/TauT family transport system substrate-binding protein
MLVFSAAAKVCEPISAQDARARNSVPVVVQTTTPVDAAPFFYAVSAKLFERAGLDVNYQTVASGSLSMVAVIGGSSNIGFGNPLSVITAYSKGAPVELVAPGSDFVPAAPTVEIFVVPDSPIRTAKDLEERSMAVTGLHDLLSISVRAWADANGADSTKIRFVELAPSAMIAGLQTKRIDAAPIFEPNRAAAIEAGLRSIGAPYAAIGKDFLTGAWFGNRTWVSQHRDAALRFADVIRVAGEYANSHYESLFPLISSYSKVTVDVLSKTNRPHFPAGISPTSIQALINVAVKYGEIPSAIRAQDVILSR